MVYKCSASGCKSGYDGQPKDASVTFHSFPLKNDNLIKKWMLAIGNKCFTPTKYSRLCSLHFESKDFIQESSDTNVTRRRSIGSRKLILRRLKKDAYPTLMLPYNHQVKQEPIEMPETQDMEVIELQQMETPESQSPEQQDPQPFENETMVPEKPESQGAEAQSSGQQSSELEFHFFGSDADESSDTTLSNIEQFLKLWPVPAGFHITSTEGHLIIYSINVDNGIPSIACSLSVTSDLRPIVSLGGSIVPMENFKDIIQGKVKKIVQVMDLLYRLETWKRSYPTP